MQDLGALSGVVSSANVINDSGQVAGVWSVTTEGGASRAFLYDGTMHDLGTLGGADTSVADINESGQIVGRSSHAFLYDGTMHDLGTLGGSFSQASAINDLGLIVGSAGTASGETHAFLYDGTMHDLGTLGGSYSYATAINRSGYEVGDAETASGGQRAFLYDGSMHDLGSLGEYDAFIFTTGINDSGRVVGYAARPFPTSNHPFYYDGTMHDLGTLGGSDAEAYDINNSGQVVGYSITASNEDHAFLATPAKYQLSGFAFPVANPPRVNIGKAGWPYPIRWSLRDATGAYVSSLSSVSAIVYKATSCAAFTDDPAGAAIASPSFLGKLRYDRRANKFIFIWKAPRQRGCYTLFVMFDDGQSIRSYFNLR